MHSHQRALGPPSATAVVAEELTDSRFTEGDSVTVRVDYFKVPHSVWPIADIAHRNVPASELGEICIYSAQLDVRQGGATALGREGYQVEADRVTAHVRMSGGCAPLPTQSKSELLDVERKRFIDIANGQSRCNCFEARSRLQ